VDNDETTRKHHAQPPQLKHPRAPDIFYILIATKSSHQPSKCLVLVDASTVAASVTKPLTALRPARPPVTTAASRAMSLVTVPWKPSPSLVTSAVRKVTYPAIVLMHPPLPPQAASLVEVELSATVVARSVILPARARNLLVLVAGASPLAHSAEAARKLATLVVV